MATFAVPLRSDRWSLLGVGPITVDAGGRAIRLVTRASGSPDNAVTAGSIEIGGNPDSDDNRYLYDGEENVWARLSVESDDAHSITVLKDGVTSAAVAPFLRDGAFSILRTGGGVTAAPGLLAGIEAQNACTITGVGLVNLLTGAVTPGVVGSAMTITGNASIAVAANGGYTLTTGTPWNGLKADETASFAIEVTVTDGTNSLTDTARFDWTVAGVNDGPSASAKTGAVTEGAVLTGNLLTDSPAVTHPQSEQLWVTKIDGDLYSGGVEQVRAKGVLIVSGDGAYSYRPTISLAAEAEETDAIEFVVSDRYGEVATATLTITITGV